MKMKKEVKIQTGRIVLFFVLCAMLNVQGALLLDDSFDDNNRSNQSLPSSAQWFGGACSVVEVSPGNYALKNAPPSATVVHMVGYFSPVGSPLTLEPGESLKLTFDVTPTSKDPAAGVNDFRFGFLHSGAARLTGDANSLLSVQGGYGTFINPQTTAVAFREKGTVNGVLFSAVTEDRWLGNVSGTAVPALPMVQNTTYSMEFVITRMANDSLQFDFSMTDGTTSTSISLNRVTNPIYSYDTLGFAWGNAFGDGLIDNVKVIHQTGKRLGLFIITQ